jgi:TRAP-type C4-dicarboxylate transport system permease small subunit
MQGDDRHSSNPSWIEGASTRQLVRHAVQTTRKLAHAEMELAQLEMKRQLSAILRFVAWCAVAFGSLLLGLTSALVASSIRSQMSAQLPWLCAVLAGMVLLVGLIMAFQTKPKQFLPRTQQRIAREAAALGKHLP